MVAVAVAVNWNVSVCHGAMRNCATPVVSTVNVWTSTLKLDVWGPLPAPRARAE